MCLEDASLTEGRRCMTVLAAVERPVGRVAHRAPVERLAPPSVEPEELVEVLLTVRHPVIDLILKNISMSDGMRMTTELLTAAR